MLDNLEKSRYNSIKIREGKPKENRKGIKKMKAYYYTTQDYNGMLITDGTEAIEIKDFPQDGTLEMALDWDLSATTGCASLADIEESIGVEFERIDFNEDEFETLEEIEMPDLEPTRDEMWNFVNAGIITEAAILDEIADTKEIRNKEAWAKKLRKLIEEDDFDGYGTAMCRGTEYWLIEQAEACGAGSMSEYYSARAVRPDEDGVYDLYWEIKDENASEEDCCDWDYADIAEKRPM